MIIVNTRILETVLILLDKCQPRTYLWSLWSTLRQIPRSRGTRWHFPSQLSSGCQPSARQPHEMLGKTPDRCARLMLYMCCHCKTRWERQRLSALSQAENLPAADTALLQALKSRGQTHGSIPGDQLGKSQGAPRDK